MENLNLIGLDIQKSAELAGKLDDLLANYSVFYQNCRGYHWNIRGEKFFELHLKFQDLYNNLFLKIDDIAERILTLGHTPTHDYSSYLQKSAIRESGKVADGRKALEEILKSLSILIAQQREILKLSGNISDEGTNSLMSDYIREQEKQVWMFTAYLNR